MKRNFLRTANSSKLRHKANSLSILLGGINELTILSKASVRLSRNKNKNDKIAILTDLQVPSAKENTACIRETEASNNRMELMANRNVLYVARRSATSSVVFHRKRPR